MLVNINDIDIVRVIIINYVLVNKFKFIVNVFIISLNLLKFESIKLVR